MVEVPARRPIIRLAYTGQQFLSVNVHPPLRVGGLRCAFEGEVLGGIVLLHPLLSYRAVGKLLWRK